MLVQATCTIGRRRVNRILTAHFLLHLFSLQDFALAFQKVLELGCNFAPGQEAMLV
jgi:hypothetical protein